MSCCAIVSSTAASRNNSRDAVAKNSGLPSPYRTNAFLILQFLRGLSILLGQFNNLRESGILREIKFEFFFQRPVKQDVKYDLPPGAARPPVNNRVTLPASTLTWARIVRRGNDVP